MAESDTSLVSAPTLKSHLPGVEPDRRLNDWGRSENGASRGELGRLGQDERLTIAERRAEAAERTAQQALERAEQAEKRANKAVEELAERN